MTNNKIETKATEKLIQPEVPLPEAFVVQELTGLKIKLQSKHDTPRHARTVAVGTEGIDWFGETDNEC